MKNQLISIGLYLFILAFSSCTAVYAPKSPDIYTFSEKGEANLSVSGNLGTGLTDHSASATLGYSPIKHLSISAEGEVATNNKIVGGNIGFYQQLSPRILFNVKVGGGLGKLDYEATQFSEVYRARGQFRRYYFLPSLSWTFSKTEFGFGIGLNNYHFRNYTFKANFEQNRNARAAHNFRFYNIQSHLFLRHRFNKLLQLNLFAAFNSVNQFGVYPLDSPTRKEYFIYNPVTSNIGLGIDLQRLFKRKEKK